jgi:hypothetical protein
MARNGRGSQHRILSGPQRLQKGPAEGNRASGSRVRRCALRPRIWLLQRQDYRSEGVGAGALGQVRASGLPWCGGGHLLGRHGSTAAQRGTGDYRGSRRRLLGLRGAEAIARVVSPSPPPQGALQPARRFCTGGDPALGLCKIKRKRKQKKETQPAQPWGDAVGVGYRWYEY